uniref:Uncharacterized protein n=1 Tax=Klebsiella pneumoniae TaxID=573 RepID=A0A8B0SXJ1_KLEPN|nr:hypothetical protein [Klebsiella pneumoniae]
MSDIRFKVHFFMRLFLVTLGSQPVSSLLIFRSEHSKTQV